MASRIWYGSLIVQHKRLTSSTHTPKHCTPQPLAHPMNNKICKSGSEVGLFPSTHEHRGYYHRFDSSTVDESVSVEKEKWWASSVVRHSSMELIWLDMLNGNWVSRGRSKVDAGLRWVKVDSRRSENNWFIRLSTTSWNLVWVRESRENFYKIFVVFCKKYWKLWWYLYRA